MGINLLASLFTKISRYIVRGLLKLSDVTYFYGHVLVIIHSRLDKNGYDF